MNVPGPLLGQPPGQPPTSWEDTCQSSAPQVRQQRPPRVPPWSCRGRGQPVPSPPPCAPRGGPHRGHPTVQRASLPHRLVNVAAPLQPTATEGRRPKRLRWHSCADQRPRSFSGKCLCLWGWRWDWRQREGRGSKQMWQLLPGPPSSWPAGLEEKRLVFRKCHLECLYPTLSLITHKKECPQRVTEFSENPTSFSRTNNRH